MEHIKGLNGAAHDAPIECGALFKAAAELIQISSDRSIRHLAKDTPCVRAGRFVYNEEQPSALDSRLKQRIGIIGDDGEIVFVAEAFSKLLSDTPTVKNSEKTFPVLREIISELSFG